MRYDQNLEQCAILGVLKGKIHFFPNTMYLLVFSLNNFQLAAFSRVLEEEDYVAVLFYEEKKRDSMKALQHLELIDDEADLFGIRLKKNNKI